MHRQDILVLAVLPTLTTVFAAFVVLIFAYPNMAVDTRLFYVEIITILFVIGFAASIVIYRFLPKTSKERANEEAEELAYENQKKLGVWLDGQLDLQIRALQEKGIQTSGDIARRLIAAAQESNPSELVDLTPLSHFKGYILPPKIEKLPDLPDGQHQASMTNVGASHPDRGRLERSQVIDTYWNVSLDDPDGINRKELIAKFGVIRVTAREKQLSNISAEFKLIAVKDAIHPTPMSYNIMNVGYLNWFSIDLRNKIRQDQSVLSEIDKNRGLGLNKYLLNPKETIHKDESKDLLVFYMIKDIPNVFICAGSTTATAGIPFGGKPCEFQFEISITADDFPKTTWSLRASAEWDDFKIQAL